MFIDTAEKAAQKLSAASVNLPIPKRRGAQPAAAPPAGVMDVLDDLNDDGKSSGTRANDRPFDSIAREVTSSNPHEVLAGFHRRHLKSPAAPPAAAAAAAPPPPFLTRRAATSAALLTPSDPRGVKAIKGGKAPPR